MEINDYNETIITITITEFSLVSLVIDYNETIIISEIKWKEEPSFDPCYPIRAVRGQRAARLQSSRPRFYCYVSITVSDLQRPLKVVRET